jgi:hypothetical protein
VLVRGLAELSYRYVEMPFRRGAFGRWWVDLRTGGVQPRSLPGAASAGLVVVTATCVLWATVPSPGEQSVAASVGVPVGGDVPETGGESSSAGDPESGSVTVDAQDKDRATGDQPKGARESRSTPAPEVAGATAGTSAAGAGPDKLTFRSAFAYSDSVVLGAAPALREKWPKVRVDAKVVRHIWINADHMKRDRARFARVW